MDIKTIKMMAENMEEFSEHAERIADTFLTVNGRHSRYIDNIEYYSGILDITYDASSCGCCRDTESISMPMEYLWEEDWKEKELARIEAEKKEKKRLNKLANARQKTAKKKAKDIKDRQDYERLKSQFEGDGS